MKYQIFNTKCNTTEKTFLLILTLFLSILTIKIFYYNSINLYTLISYISLVIIFSLLAFLAYYDFVKMEVHSNISFVLMIVLVLLNILLYSLKGDIQVINGWVYSPYQNILSILFLGTLFQLTVLVSKEKALGQGDVRIAIITGSLIGFGNIIYWSYITIFSALVYGVYIAYKKKRFRGLRIPFVPFMVLGTVLIILFLSI